MKSMVNFKVLEQSIRLASKASDLERHSDDDQLTKLLHEVNLVALGIPNIISEQSQLTQSDNDIESLLKVIDGLKSKIKSLPNQSEAVFEFARLLDLESELVSKYYTNSREVKRPVRTSRLEIQDRSRVNRSFNAKVGFQTSLF